jgi:hypothetical protein
MHKRLLIALAVILFAGLLQAFPSRALQQKEEGGGDIQALVKDLETALFSGNLKSISGRLGKQVFLSLKGGESGYFSANQAHYVLQDYFSARRVVSLHFGAVVEREGSPYSTGGGTIKNKGAIQPLQLFVAFARLDGRWVITQLNVY